MQKRRGSSIKFLRKSNIQWVEREDAWEAGKVRGKTGVMQGGKWKREVSCVDAEREETRKKPPLSF